MIRNLLIDALALVGIFAMCFAILFLGYGFTNDSGIGLFFPGMAAIFGRFNNDNARLMAIFRTLYPRPIRLES
jgi:hypothetical protein